MISYTDALTKGFSDVVFSCTGAGTSFEDIVWVENGATPPTKAELDLWIQEYTRAELWELIKGERDRRRSVGGYKVGNYWFHSDDSSRIQQLGLVMSGQNLPGSFMWKTMSGDFVQMTPTLAVQIFQAGGVSDIALFTVAEQKRAALAIATDLENYDYLSGWPLIYGE